MKDLLSGFGRPPILHISRPVDNSDGVAYRLPRPEVPMLHLRRVVPIVLLVLAVNSVAAYAQDATLSDEQVQKRLTFITAALQDGQPAAKRWWYGWIAGYSAGAAGMGIVAATSWKSQPDIMTFAPLPPVDNSTAQDMLVGSGTFALGVVGLVIDPFTPATAAKKLKPMPEGTPEERLAKLQRAEELLRKCAKREKSGRGLTTHLLNAGVNAAAGVVTVAAFDRPATDGLITFAIGEAVSLLNIFTQPMKAVRDLKKYEAGLAAGELSLRPKAEWSLGFCPGGVSFRLSF